MYSTNCGTHSQRCSAYEKNTSFVEFWLRSRQKRYLAKRWSKASRHSNGPKARFRIEDVLHHENSEGTGRRPVPNAAGRPSWARSLPNRVAGGAKRSWQLGLAEERAQLVSLVLWLCLIFDTTHKYRLTPHIYHYFTFVHSNSRKHDRRCAPKLSERRNDVAPYISHTRLCFFFLFFLSKMAAELYRNGLTKVGTFATITHSYLCMKTTLNFGIKMMIRCCNFQI